MRIQENKIEKYIVWLLIISALVRGFLAAFIEFGNDEVYYWTFAMYPDWSQFDHPNMVGWMMQLFSLNLLFDSEFALRLSSVVFMTIDTYIIYRIGCLVKNKLTGFYAALLYTASLYCFIITGIFIMPDTPLMMFTLLSIYCFLLSFQGEAEESAKHYVLAGLFAGLALLSKYSAVFIWSGVGLYVLLFDRKQLKNKYLYLSALISAVCMLPVLIWNIQNDFISFTFHGDRVSLFGKLQPLDFIAEIFGELGYNNPVNYVLIIIALVVFFKRKKYIGKTSGRVLLCFALPFIAVFWFFSLTRPILPHWSAPAFSLLLLFPASYLADKQSVADEIIKLPKPIIATLSLLILVLIFGVLEIKTGVVPLRFGERANSTRYYGEGDFTTTIYGWRSIKDDFQEIRQKKIDEGVMKESDGMVGLQWFPMANFDYYVANPLGINMYGLRGTDKIHKYTWINEYRGGLKKGSDYWFLNESSDYYAPEKYLEHLFDEVVPCDTITVERCGKPAKYVFVYMCKGLK
ncbi:MAG: glycosyltransferase family 39 protein [Bacteroidales bacterium]|nr:glycosyltransferase family 39 protein [Bacteroidales bacterium]